MNHSQWSEMKITIARRGYSVYVKKNIKYIF